MNADGDKLTVDAESDFNLGLWTVKSQDNANDDRPSSSTDDDGGILQVKRPEAKPFRVPIINGEVICSAKRLWGLGKWLATYYIL